MKRLIISALAFAALATTVQANGPRVVFSKTWYEPFEYADLKGILRHFSFTFDQSIYLKDKYGRNASIVDPIWYFKEQPDGSLGPRLMCMSAVEDGMTGDASMEPFEADWARDVYVGKEPNGWFPAQVPYSPDYNLYQGCAPYFFRAFDGNFILTDTRNFWDFVQLGPNFHFTYASKHSNMPITVRLPDYDGTAITPGVKANDRGYNTTMLYFDLTNYNVDNIPFDLLDDKTLELIDFYYVEDMTPYFGSNVPYPIANNYGSAAVIAGREYYGKLLYGNGNDLVPQLTLLCNSNTAGVPYTQQLHTFDPTYDWGYIPNNKRALISNAAGEECISGASAHLNWNQSSCTVDDLNALNQKFADIQAQMLKTNSVQALTTLQISLKTLAAQYPYDACFAYIQTLYNTTTTEVELPGQTQCSHNYGTLDYAVDPCCNLTLSYTQCCAPTVIKKTSSIATAISDGAQCTNPSVAFQYTQILVESINADAANTQTAANVPTATLAKLTAFQGTCQNILFNTTCATDQDCQYGSTCDPINEICIPPYDNLTAVTLACYSDKMDQDLMNRLVAQLGVERDSDGQPVATDFLAKISAAVVRDDCVGPTAAEYRTRYQYGADGRIVTDKFGSPVVLAGNQQSCLAEQQCAYTTLPGQACGPTQTSGNNFCGLCNDQTCVDITRPAQCVVTAYDTQNLCTAAGLYWQLLDSKSVYSRFFPDQSGVCLDLTATTEQQCLATSICPNSAAAGDSLTRCAQQFCYDSTITTPQVCKKRGGDWNTTFNSGSGLCIDTFDPEDFDSDDDFNALLKLSQNNWQAYLKAFKARLLANKGCTNGFTRFTGRAFIPGKFNTPESCAVGQCSIRNDNLQYSFETETLNQQQCAALQQCSTTCPRCRSSFAVDSYPASELVCYETKASKKSINNAQKCRKDGGVWTRLADKSYICRYWVDKATCVAAGHQIADCSGMTKGTCYSGTSAIDLLLQCHWSDSSTCPIGTCSQQGFCNDAEFINSKVPAAKNGVQPSGACLVPAPIDGVTARPCGVIQTINNSTVYTYQVASKIAGLCLDFSLDKIRCQAAGFTFQDVASTASDCAAHGTNCFETDGTFTAKPQAQCQTCGGKSIAAYRWTQAQVENGFIRTNTAWKAREMVPVNKWKPTVVFPLLDQLIERVALRKVAVQQISAISLEMSIILSTMNALSCDCTTKYKALNDEPFLDPLPTLHPGDTSCYDQTPIQQSIGDLVPGSALQLFTIKQELFIDQTTGNGLTKTIRLNFVTAQSTFNNVSAVAVSDSTGAVIAYLAGHGFNLNDSVLVGTATTTMALEKAAGPIGALIPADFNAPGVAQLVNGQFLQLLETDATFVDSNMAVQTASIAQAGTYFPVKVTAQTRQIMASLYSSKLQALKASHGSMTTASMLLIVLLAVFQLLF